jgi:hypothetical protein
LAVVERTWQRHPVLRDRWLSHYAVRHLQRWPLQTGYTAIAADLARLVSTPPLDCPLLIVDQTAVGSAVVDLLKRGQVHALLRPVVITTGQASSFGDAGVWRVPKKDLIACLQVPLQARRLHVAPLPERDLLVRELMAFREKESSAKADSLESWRERDHDDLVLAVALAVWWAERFGSPPCVGRSAQGLRRHVSLEDRLHGPRAAERRGLFGLGSKDSR